jgi:hypothetical protein
MSRRDSEPYKLPERTVALPLVGVVFVIDTQGVQRTAGRAERSATHQVFFGRDSFSTSKNAEAEILKLLTGFTTAYGIAELRNTNPQNLLVSKSLNL